MLKLGQLYITPGVQENVPALSITEAILRHSNCEWGEVCAEDQAANDRALLHGDRVLSSFTASSGVKFWVITEADRSSTTLLLPEEY